MLKIGIISNPRSHRNRRAMAGLRELIAGQAEVLHVEIDDMADLAEILADFSRREVGRIVVNGGDGTVHSRVFAPSPQGFSAILSPDLKVFQTTSRKSNAPAKEI